MTWTQNQFLKSLWTHSDFINAVICVVGSDARNPSKGTGSSEGKHSRKRLGELSTLSLFQVRKGAPSKFLPCRVKKEVKICRISWKKTLSLTLMEERGYSILFNFPIAWLCSLTPTYPHTQRHPRDVPSCDQGHFCSTWEHLMLFNISLCFLLTESNQIVLCRFFKNQQLLWQDLLPQNLP